MKEIPKNAIELAKKFEGFSTKPYLCPGGFWTIGYGHRCESDHPEITEEEGLEFLKQDMESAVKSTLLYCPALSEDEKKLGAIADFVFNLGAQRLKESTLRKRINEQRWSEAATELNKWVYGGGKVLPGLIKRRAEEVKYLKGE